MRGTKPKLVVSNESVTRIPAPPSHLSTYAKAEWKRIVPDLIARGIFTDPPLVENYCNAMSGAREARRAHRGRMMLDGKAHPAVGMEQRYLEIARRHAAELGLTPVARQRAALIGKPPEESGDSDWS